MSSYLLGIGGEDVVVDKVDDTDENAIRLNACLQRLQEDVKPRFIWPSHDHNQNIQQVENQVCDSKTQWVGDEHQTYHCDQDSHCEVVV